MLSKAQVQQELAELEAKLRGLSESEDWMAAPLQSKINALQRTLARMKEELK